MKKIIKQFEPYIRRKDAKAVYRTIKRGFIGPGCECVRLEEKIKQLLNVKYCFTTTSGTTALLMAIESLNLPKGSTIAFPAYTFLAGANAARFMGYKIKLIDINSWNLCMSPELLKKCIKNIRCVIFVNHNAYFGDALYTIKQICQENKVPMIEDSSQCIGIYSAGVTGNIGVYSFSVPKLVNGGQGGVVFTNNDKIAKRLGEIRDHGDKWRIDRIHRAIGVNFRYNDIQASYVLSQLNDIKYLLTKKWRICNEYYKYIEIEGFYADSYSNEVPWMIVYRSEKATDIIEALRKEGIDAVRYYRPIHHNPPYKTKKEFPMSEKAYNELIYLPSSLNLSKRQIKKICKIILKVEDKK